MGHTLNKKRIGETRLMSCGLEATIIAYRNYKDIDIKFADGTIVTNKQYIAFKRGYIKNPKNAARPGIARKTGRVGETRVMKNGLTATIIAYRGVCDIDVKFENNVIAEGTDYATFRKGLFCATKQTNKSKRLHEKRMMNCGLEAEIVVYNACNDIDVKFSNGIIVRKKRYSDFVNGAISYYGNKGRQKIDRTGETRIMKCGMNATIVKYDTVLNIDVQFEDGTIVKNKLYACFKDGYISHPNMKKHKINNV